MAESKNLQLPFLTAAQAHKHVTVNESLLRLDALVQLSVVSATTRRVGRFTRWRVEHLPRNLTHCSETQVPLEVGFRPSDGGRRR